MWPLVWLKHRRNDLARFGEGYAPTSGYRDAADPTDLAKLSARHKASRHGSIPRIHLIVALVLIAVATLLSWLVVANYRRRAEPPVICRNPIWDFGSISQMKPGTLTKSFAIENTSNVSLRIHKVLTDCGCIVPETAPTQIGSNSSVELPLSVNPPAAPGPFQRFVHVVIGTSPISRLTLTVRGEILPSPAFYWAPTRLDFGDVSDTESRVRSIKLARYDGSAVRFLRADPTSKALSVERTVSGDSADSFIDLTIAIDGSLAGAAGFASSIVVVTGHPTFRNVELPVAAKIVEQPNGLANSIIVGRLARGEFRDASLADVHCLGPRPVVEAIHYEGEGSIAVQLVTLGDSVAGSPVARVRVSRTNGPAETKVSRGALLVTLQGRRKPVRIPMSIYLPD